jgi:RNA polymerase sigma-70 factor (ECF subfamily)
MIDEKALFRLVADLRPFVIRLTRSAEAADDVLQEAFLKILLHREKLDAVENPRAYIIRIVSNESINYLRVQARNGKLLAELQPQVAEEAPSPEQHLFYREMEAQLNDAIERLPQACRKIYRMSRDQYMRIPEIARQLNLSDSTVKNQLVKALKSLRRVVLFLCFFVL